MARQLETIKKPKAGTKKRPTSQPQIIDCGILSDDVWPGAVSAKTVLDNTEINSTKLEEIVKGLNAFYISTDMESRTRCIDGRHDPQLDEIHLGPQVPGGAPGAALSYRLGVSTDDLLQGTFLHDAEEMIGNFLRLGWAPGGHTDNQQNTGTVGCGAIEGLDRILATMTTPNLVDDHERVVKVLMGAQYDRDTYLRIMGAAVLLNARAADYFRNRREILSILEKRAPGSIAVLEGKHKEALFIVNAVPGTTFSSNKFAKAHNGMQAFGYDLWYSVEGANRFLPRPDQAFERERYLMARVMTTVATLMALTDGTQHIVLRLPATSSL